MVQCVEVDRCMTPHRQHSCSRITWRMEGCASHPDPAASFHERLVEDGGVKECVHDSPRLATLPSQWPSEALLTHTALSRHLLYCLRLRAIVLLKCNPWIEVVTTTKCREARSSKFMGSAECASSRYTRSRCVPPYPRCHGEERKSAREWIAVFWPKECSDLDS